MAVLSFKVQADYEKVARLREEIVKLENQLKSFGRNTPVKEIKEIETKLAATKKEFTAMATQAAETGAVVNTTFKQMAASVGALFSVQKAVEFASQVASVRGEFQKLEMSFETMLQSKEKADALMAQIVDTAAKTPFDLQGVASGAKQLLAYGVASEQVNDTLIRLGDIAAGLSIPLGDLVYLYGTTMAQGRMFTMDLRQFQGRGIPMTEELAKVMGVAKNEVAGLVTAGKVGFKEMEQAIKNMTTEGGKFANLMEKQSKTISGQMANLEDSISQMFNEIGESTEDTISGAISVVSNLVENYKEVGETIGKIVLIAGTYKAALAAMSAVNTAAAKAEASMLTQLLTVKTQENAADSAGIAITGKAVAANNAEVVSLRQEVAARLESLRVTMLQAKGEEAAATTAAERIAVQLSLSKIRVKQAKEELALATASGNQEAINAAKTELATAAKERNNLSRELGVATRAQEIAATNAEAAASAFNTMQTNIETAAIDNQTKSTLLLSAAKEKLASVGRGIGKVLSNPYVLASAAVAALTASVIGMVDALKVEDEAHKNVTDAIEKHNAALDETKSKGEQLINVIKDETRTNLEKAKALNELRSLYPSLFKDMSDAEIMSLKQVEANKQLAEETERLREEELRLSLQRKREALAAQEGVNTVQGANGAVYSVNTGDSVQARRLREEIKIIEEQLKELGELKKKADFNALPKEAKIVSLKEQIADLEKENKELDKQIEDINVKQWTIADLGNLTFDWSSTNSAEELLAIIEGNRKKAQELTKELQKLEAESDTNAETDKQKQARYNRKKARERAEEEMSKAEADLQHKVTQSRIDAMDEGLAKELAQLELNYDKQTKTYEREQKDLLKKLQNDELQKWLAADSDRKEYNFVPTINENSPEYKKFAEQYAKLAADALASYNKAIEEAELEWSFANRQARIDAMADDEAKERAQRMLDNEKELFNLEQQRKAYIEAAKAAHILAEKKKMAADPTHTMQAFDESAANADYDAIVAETQKRQDEVLVNEYMSYIDKKKAIDASYEADKAELEAAYAKTGDEKYKRSLGERTKAYTQSLFNLEKSFDDSYKVIFKDPSRMTQEGLYEALDLAEEKLKELIETGAQAETIEPLYEQIAAIRDELDNYDLSGIVNDFMSLVMQAGNLAKARQRLDSLDKSSDLYKKEKEAVDRAEENLRRSLVATGVSEFAGMLDQAAEAMHMIAQESGNVKLAELAHVLSTTGGIINSAINGMLQAGPAGLLVGLVTSAVGAITNLALEAEIADEKLSHSLEAFRRELQLTQLQIDSVDFQNLFGTQDFEMANEALIKAREAVALYEQELEKIKSLIWKYGTGVNWFPEEGVLFETYDKIEGLRNKDIWDESGMLDLEKAKAFLATSETITDEAREQVEYVIALQEAYEAARKVLDDFLSSFIGSTAQDLTDAIFEGIDSGSDAWDIFEEKGAQTIRSLGKQMLNEVIQKSLSEMWTDKLREAAGSPDELAETYADMMDWLKSQMGAYQDAAAAWEAQYGQMYDSMAEESQQEASRKGYETLSEDTGNELVGRALAQYESNLRMEDAMRSAKESIDLMAINQVQIRDIAAESRALIADSYLELQQIRENTGAIIKPITEMNRKMNEWDSKIKSL